MLDLVVNYWGRLISALITGGPAGYWLMARGRGSADDARGATEAKAAEDTRRAAEAKAAQGAPSCAATHPGKRTEEMAVPPADLRLIKGIVAKPTHAASQKRTAPRMKAK